MISPERDLKSQLDLLRLKGQIENLLFHAQLKRSCLGCRWFDEARELCGIAGSRPPARVIAFGCKMHEEAAPF